MIPGARERLEAAGVRILLEDNHLLVVSKPSGLLSQGADPGTPHLVELLEAYRREAEGKPGRAYVGLVHRLDRNVSGVLVVARTSKAAARLSARFRDPDGGLEKTYLAWVAGIPVPRTGTLVDRLERRGRMTTRGGADAREARLDYVVEAVGHRSSRLRLTLHGGFTHQIRAQLALGGHPLLGDPKYGGPRRSRLALHALRITFPHPIGGSPVTVEAPIPRDLRKLDETEGLTPPLP